MCCHNRNKSALRPHQSSSLLIKSLPSLKSLLISPRIRQSHPAQSQEPSQAVYRYPTAELVPNGPPPAYELVSPASEREVAQTAEVSLRRRGVEAPDTQLGSSARTQYFGAEKEYHGDWLDLSHEKKTLQTSMGQNSAVAAASGYVQSAYDVQLSGRCADRIKRKQEKAQIKLERQTERFTRKERKAFPKQCGTH